MMFTPLQVFVIVYTVGIIQYASGMWIGVKINPDVMGSLTPGSIALAVLFWPFTIAAAIWKLYQ